MAKHSGKGGRNHAHKQSAPRSQKRADRQEARKARRLGNVFEIGPDMAPDFEQWHRPKDLSFLSEAQYQYAQLIKNNILTIGEGPAGTGKSYVATAIAAEQLVNREIKKIIVTRPVISAEEDIGFLPGTEEEKCAPYFAPIREILVARMGESHVELKIKRKEIVFAPMGFLRGLTFDDAFIILDEAQNTTPKQMKLFLTRVGKNCTVVVDGDTDQRDIPCRSGLEDVIERLVGMDKVGHMVFDEDDIVRSGFVKDLLKRYASHKAKNVGDRTQHDD